MLSNTKEQMAQLKESKGVDVIPKGDYCYCNMKMTDRKTEEGLPILHVDLCPYWDADDEAPPQSYGYCWYLEKGDWEENGTFLLFDQVKECGINGYSHEEEEEFYQEWKKGLKDD